METPEDYKTAGIVNMIAGGVTAVTSLMVGLSLLIICVGFLWFIPMLMGAWQMWIGFQMYSGEPQTQAKTSAIVGLIAAILSMNIISIAASAFTMITVDKPEVKGWLEQNAL